MRLEDIRFKAKKVSDGHWVYGDLIHGLLGEPVIRDSKALWHTVDPSTVCQYTGAKDANGTDLYENDIIHFKGYKPTGIIKWVDDAYAFMVEYDGNLEFLSNVLDIGKVEIVCSAFDKEVDDEADL